MTPTGVPATGPRRHRRTAFSLLEVVLATSLLVGCLIVLSELAAIGRRHVQTAQALTAAQTACENLINEIQAGVRPPEPLEDQAIEELPGWLYSVEVQSLPQTGLLQVQVVVEEDVASRKPRSFALVQWLRDPAGRRQPEDPAPPLPPGRRQDGEFLP